MICVFEPLAADFSGNGKAALMPTGGSIRMVAAGDYSFTMEHPIDPWGKWKELKREAIVKLPVPEEVIPNSFSGVEADVYKTTADAPLYQTPLAPTTITYPTWPSTTMNPTDVGAKTSWMGKNYQCIYFDGSSRGAGEPPSEMEGSWWTQIARQTPGAAVLVTLKAGTELYLVEDVDTDWLKLCTKYGLTGYVLKTQATYDHHASASENQPRVITEQLFRIKEVNVDRDSGKVNVSGVHVSYDLNGDLVDDIEMGQVSAAMAIGRIYENLLMDYRGMIATDLTDTGNVTFSGKFGKKNGMYCLTDPESGVVATFGAKLTRDNWDLFVLEKTATERGYRIRYAKNVNGIQWKEKTDKLVTRVIPVAKKADGSDLYLPEKWVDSTHISDYPVIYMETLKVNGQVGKDDGSGTDTVWTEADLLDEMRAKAGERFSVEKVDEPVTEVTVQLQALENTAEYAYLKDLLNVLLYDTVTVSDPEIGKSAVLTVTEIEWDYILKKVSGLKLSNVDTNITKSVTGYNVANGSIGQEKLKDDVIRQAVSDAVGNAEEASSQRIPYNGKDRDGIVAKGYGHDNKVWKTDGQGVPGWRTESAAVPVVDALDSTSTTSALSANQGRVLNGHFVSIGSAQNPVTDLANIPLNSIGNAVLAAAISPAGVLRSHSFWKSGSSATRYVIFAVDQYANRAYYQINFDGTLQGWTLVDRDSAFYTSTKTVPENSTLGSYLTPGVYTVLNGTTAATISDCPYTNSGGRLEVIGQNHSGSNYLRQIYYPAGSVYIYTRIRSDTAWGSWYKISMTQA